MSRPDTDRKANPLKGDRIKFLKIQRHTMKLAASNLATSSRDKIVVAAR